MADKLSKEKRSWNMSRIRSTDTKPEILLRSALHSMGFRFRLHQRGLPGRPDIILPKYRTVIFVHGCFWHQHPGCIEAVRPKTNQKYWETKLDGNVERDRKNQQALREQGWNVAQVWECQIKKDPFSIAMQITKNLLSFSWGWAGIFNSPPFVADGLMDYCHIAFHPNRSI